MLLTMKWWYPGVSEDDMGRRLWSPGCAQGGGQGGQGGGQGGQGGGQGGAGGGQGGAGGGDVVELVMLLPHLHLIMAQHSLPGPGSMSNEHGHGHGHGHDTK